MPARQLSDVVSVSLPVPGAVPRPAFLPPHTVSPRRPRSAAPAAAQLLRRSVDAGIVMMRSPILAALILAFGLSGCGRSDVLEGDPAGIYVVDGARELDLDDGDLVYVELAAPVSPAVSAAVMGLEDGCSLDELIDALAPEGDPRLRHFGEVAIHVRVDDELRGVIWR